jgi:hypothetical protein
MNEMPFREERWFFRFVGLNRERVDEIQKTWQVEVTHHQDARNFVVSLELVEGTDYQKLVELVSRWRLPRTSHGLWISLVTERDSDGVHVPEFATELLLLTGGTIDFSFTLT